MGLTARVPELLDHGGDGKLSRQKAGNLMAALSTVKILLSLADGDQQVCNCSYLSSDAMIGHALCMLYVKHQISFHFAAEHVCLSAAVLCRHDRCGGAEAC